MTKSGHAFAAYLLVLIALGHWIEARRLDDEDKPPAVTGKAAG